MFREMRRNKQLLSPEEATAILERNSYGVVGVIGDEGYPYTVPMSYIYYDGKIYFHTAKTGHKVDAIKANDKVTFCVVDKDQVVPEEYTTYFRSAVAFGRAKIVEDAAEKQAAFEALAAKYSPNQVEGRLAEIAKVGPAAFMIRIDIEHLTGKEAIELVRARG